MPFELLSSASHSATHRHLQVATHLEHQPSNLSVMMSITLESELRHLPATHRHQLVGLLDVNDNWKALASTVPNPDRPSELLLKTTDIALLEEQRKRPGGSPSNALLEYWGTYGRKRATIAEMIAYLEHCALNRAADLVRVSVAKPSHKNDKDPSTAQSSSTMFFSTVKKNPMVDSWSDLPEYTSVADQSSNNSSQLTVKPSAPTQSLISFESIDEGSTEKHFLLTSSEQEVPVRLFYRDVQRATENFSTQDIWHGGTKIGEGSFGEVFRCNAALLNSVKVAHLRYVAVKRFKQLPIGANEADVSQKSAQFVSELTTMYRLQHPNLIRLFGYSNDGPYLCIVTEYLENGSLQDFLTKQQQQQQNHSQTPLSFVHRWQIALDVAKALVYLHNYTVPDKDSGAQVVKPYVHRDIKSANIFLDDKLGARLGDLGLVRQGSTSNASTTVVTSTIIGTSVYMAPEAFRGDVSVKIDTFSYGVVLFELITGMAAYDSDRDESDIVSYIDELLGDEFDKLSSLEANGRKYLLDFINNASVLVDQEVMEQVFDPKCLDWNPEAALKLTILAKCCIEQRKKNRPTMNEVMEVLKQISCDS